VGDDLVVVPVGVPQDIHRQHDALRPEAVRASGDQLRVEHGLAIDAHLVRARAQQRAHLVGRAHPATDGQWNEHLIGRPVQHIDEQPAIFSRGRDVVEDELVGPLGVVALGELDGIAGVADVDEVRALDHPSAVDVQAGNHALEMHGAHGSDRTADRRSGDSPTSVARRRQVAAGR